MTNTATATQEILFYPIYFGYGYALCNSCAKSINCTNGKYLWQLTSCDKCNLDVK